MSVHRSDSRSNASSADKARLSRPGVVRTEVLGSAPIQASFGFTLIELLIVISILAILASMAMPILGIANRAARNTATRSVMHKVDTALRLFRSEVGSFPYQGTYADIANGESWDNRLNYHLGSEIATADLAQVHADAADAAAQYTYDCTPMLGTSPVEPSSAGKPHMFKASDCRPAAMTDATGKIVWFRSGGVWKSNLEEASSQMKMGTAVMLNRMGAERARRSVMSGNPWLKGVMIADSFNPDGVLHAPGRDNRAVPVLADPKSKDTPGWASDYLAGEVESRFIRGDQMLDGWQRPLIYICQVTEGCQATRGLIFGNAILRIEARTYGLQRQGRRVLAAVDPENGAPLTADPSYLPNPGDLWNSDRRVYAGSGHEDSFELWSAGPDGRFDWMRPHRWNIDNVGHEPYDLGLR